MKIETCSKKALTDAVLDNYAALHRPVSVKEKGSKFMQGVHGIILRPHECYMDLIGPFKEPEDFWDICNDKFSGDTFMVVPHLSGINPTEVTCKDEQFVWQGNYEEFKSTWELD